MLYDATTLILLIGLIIEIPLALFVIVSLEIDYISSTKSFAFIKKSIVKLSNKINKLYKQVIYNIYEYEKQNKQNI